MSKKKDNDNLLLQNLIKLGDDLIDKIINNKTVKSHYVRKEEGKLVTLQFPVQDRVFWDGIERKYEKFKQTACTSEVDEHMEIVRIFCQTPDLVRRTRS